MIIHSPYEGNPAPELNRDAEGLQVDPNGLYPQPSTGAQLQNWLFAHEENGEKQAMYEDGKLMPSKGAQKKRRGKRIYGLPKRTFVIIAIVSAITVVCIAGGVAGYYANRSSSPTQTSNPSTSPTSTILTGTSGTTDFAERPCEPATVSPPSAPQAIPRDISNPYITTGATFNITCRRLPASGGIEQVPLHNIAQFIEYNFTSCMEKCAENLGCGGVVYGANLTDMVADGDPGGNCLLKNGSWVASQIGKMWHASAVRL